MTTPILYHSGQSGAPQIVANDSQTVLNVIKACLVGVGGVAYGSKAPAGWTAPYEDAVAHKLVVRQGGGNQFYLRLGDSAVTSADQQTYGKRYLCVRGYESMTAIDTGTNAFPTTAQHALNSYYWAFACGLDSGNSDTHNLRWVLIADDRFFYFVVYPTNFSSNYSAIMTYFFGDIVPNKSDDAYHTVIYGNTDTSAAASTLNVPNCGAGTDNGSQSYNWKPFYSVTSGSSIPGLYVSRPYNQIGSASGVGMHSDAYKASDFWGLGALAYPDKIDGGVYTSLAWVTENTGGNLIRGKLPGLYVPNSRRPMDNLTEFTGSGSFAGVPFVTLRSFDAADYYVINSYCVFIKMSDWRT